jgi:hypothetical protein
MDDRADPAAVDAVLTASRAMVAVATHSLGAAWPIPVPAVGGPAPHRRDPARPGGQGLPGMPARGSVTVKEKA